MFHVEHFAAGPLILRVRRKVDKVQAHIARKNTPLD